VQFYSNEQSLFDTVADFLGDGLRHAQPAIMFATAAHRRAIEKHLRDRSIDCEAARRQGDLLALDAEEMLELFMVAGRPHPDLFEANIGRLIEQLLSGRQQTIIRAYGEMVDVLWTQGEPQAALDLEILWNKLALKYDFTLLCGYSMGSFYKQPKSLEKIAALHSEVVDDGLAYR
jgi:hypothetical protein